MKNLSLLAPIAALVCAAVVCGAVLLWAPVCAGMLELTNGNMVPMRCTYTAKVDTPLSIGVCKSADMACQATAVWLRIAGGVSAVAALAGALVNPDRKRVAE